MGSTRRFDAFTFFFRETEHGIFIAHCYQYEADHSTLVIETDPDDLCDAPASTEWTRRHSARFLEGVFAEELEGQSSSTNRSLWRNFPMIRNARWVKDNVVLLGDAKATAHFSIGSGTKLAHGGRDRAASRRLSPERGDVAGALAAFERDAARGGGEDPARGRCFAGLVRACDPLLGHGPARASPSA